MAWRNVLISFDLCDDKLTLPADKIVADSLAIKDAVALHYAERVLSLQSSYPAAQFKIFRVARPIWDKYHSYLGGLVEELAPGSSLRVSLEQLTDCISLGCQLQSSGFTKLAIDAMQKLIQGTGVVDVDGNFYFDVADDIVHRYIAACIPAGPFSELQSAAIRMLTSLAVVNEHLSFKAAATVLEDRLAFSAEQRKRVTDLLRAEQQHTSELTNILHSTDVAQELAGCEGTITELEALVRELGNERNDLAWALRDVKRIHQEELNGIRTDFHKRLDEQSRKESFLMADVDKDAFIPPCSDRSCSDLSGSTMVEHSNDSVIDQSLQDSHLKIDPFVPADCGTGNEEGENENNDESGDEKRTEGETTEDENKNNDNSGDGEEEEGEEEEEEEIDRETKKDENENNDDDSDEEEAARKTKDDDSGNEEKSDGDPKEDENETSNDSGDEEKGDGKTKDDDSIDEEKQAGENKEFEDEHNDDTDSETYFYYDDDDDDDDYNDDNDDENEEEQEEEEEEAEEEEEEEEYDKTSKVGSKRRSRRSLFSPSKVHKGNTGRKTMKH